MNELKNRLREAALTGKVELSAADLKAESAGDARPVEPVGDVIVPVAEQAAREATNKKQRDEAARLTEEARVLQQQAAQSAIEVVAVIEKVEERAGTAAYLSSRPIVADTAKGQKLAQDWEITVTDPYTLAKYHPHAVTIKPLIGAIKEMLREGINVQGITAVETVNTAVRAKRERPAIDL